MAPSTPNPNLDQWWGYHAKVGWVVLDRHVAQNSVGSSRDALVFVRCSDWVLFEVKRHAWFPPLFTFAPNYLSTLIGESRRKAELEWQQAREAFAERRRWLRQGARNFKAYQAARERLQREQAERAKQKILNELNEDFESDFLSTFDLYKAKYADYITLEEFESARAAFVQSWIAQNLELNVTVPDEEQAAAVAVVEGHVQVVARAGSGKTRVLVQRAVFLQKHCCVAPNEMLLLAFNGEAAGEIRERLKGHLGSDVPNALTFHALARGIANPKEKILEERDRYKLVQSIVELHLKEPKNEAQLRELLMAHFREDWEHIFNSNGIVKQRNLEHLRRSLPYQGFDGHDYKSRDEKLIADFLFEHSVIFEYERHFTVGYKRGYRPDFTLEHHNVVIEYFGLTGEKDYDETTKIKQKYWRDYKAYKLLAYYPQDVRDPRIFLERFKLDLETCGVTCTKLSENELWEKIGQEQKPIAKFTKLVDGFIGRCCKQHLTPEGLAEHISRYKSASAAEMQFLPLALKFYEAYLQRLKDEEKTDFDALLRRAAECTAQGDTQYVARYGSGDLKTLKYLFIDEYQDFSKGFLEFVKAIQSQAPDVKVFCVGDDWQAINGFAGSDLRYYRNFTDHFEEAGRLDVSTNYRSVTSVVAVGNALMHGLGRPAIAYQKEAGQVFVADLKAFCPSAAEQKALRSAILLPALARLIANFHDQSVAPAVRADDKGIVLLSRKKNVSGAFYNSNATHGNKRGIDWLLLDLKKSLPKRMKEHFFVETAHKYKGKQKHTVIVIDAVARSYPLLHPYSRFTTILGDSLEQTVEEERRLFYVALTRAVENLVIITDSTKGQASPFLNDIAKTRTCPELDLNSLPPLMSSVTIKVENSGSSLGTKKIKEFLLAERYRPEINAKFPVKSFWYKDFDSRLSLENVLNQSSWVSKADGVIVRTVDDLDRTLETYQINQGRLSKLTF